MKIIILHGDNIDAIDKRLMVFIKEANKRNWEIRRIDINKNIAEQFATQSLFKKEVLFLLDSPQKLTNKSLDWLNKSLANIAGTLITYSYTTLNKTLIKIFPKPDKIEEFKMPFLLWSFLASFYPGNRANCLKILHKAADTISYEFIFAMLAKQLRDLYIFKVDPKNTGFGDWKKSKLSHQSLKFSEELIREIINEMAEIDIKVKSSQGNIGNLLDFLIISKLE